MRFSALFSLFILIFLLLAGSDARAQTSLIGNNNDKKESHAPVVKNLRFEAGALMLDAGGSYIATDNARLIVNDAEAFPLNIDDSGVFFRVGKERTSAPGGKRIVDAIPQNQEVYISVENPGGERSEAVKFRR